MGTVCRELCKNGLTYRDAVWTVDSGGPNAQKALLDVVQTPMRRGNFERGRNGPL